MAKLNFKKLGTAVAVRGGGALIGGAAGAAVNKIIPASLNPIIRNGLKAVVGAVAPEISPKSEFLKYAGAGMVGQAGGELFNHFVNKDAVTGSDTVGAVPFVGDSEYIIDEVTGTDDDDDVQIISGDDEDEIYGTDDEDEIYGVDDEDEDPIV